MKVRMNNFLIVLLIFSISACLHRHDKIAQLETQINRLNPSLKISIPQELGVLFVHYKIVEIKNDSLFMIDKNVRLGQIENDSLWSVDTTARYKLNIEMRLELCQLIASVDTFGSHAPKGYLIPMGNPRFYIEAGINGKTFNGSISNCYREQIFKFVDFMNKWNPEGPILHYNKAKLLKLEQNLSDR
jgi:hypothetical protein